MMEREEFILTLTWKRDIEGNYGLISFDDTRLWFLGYGDSIPDVDMSLASFCELEYTFKSGDYYIAIYNVRKGGER